MSANTRKAKGFAAKCVLDHKKAIARAIRGIAKQNGWGCVQLGDNSKTSTTTTSFVTRGDEHMVSLQRLCLMAYELGIAIELRITSPIA